MNIKGKNIAGISFFSSLLILIIINLTTGSFFEEYYSLYNAIFLTEFINTPDYSFIATNWLGLIPIIGKISGLFPSLAFFSLFNSFIDLILLSTFIASLLILHSRSDRKYYVLALIGFIFVLFYFDNLFYIHDRRVALTAPFVSFLWYFLVSKYLNSKYLYFISAFLLIIGILARVEVAIISISLLTVFSLLFLSHKNSKVLFLYLGTALIIYGSFEFVHVKYYPDIKKALVLEHELIDRQNISINSNDTVLFPKQLAMMFFIKDDSRYTLNSYDTFIAKKSLLEYISKHPNFLEIYLSKLYSLANELQTHFWLILLAIINFIICLFIASNRKASFIYSLKISLLASSFVCAILFVNLFVIFPSNLLIAICILVNISSVFLYAYNDLFNSKKALAINFLFSALLFPIYLYNLVPGEQAKQSKAMENRSFLNSVKNKEIVIANLPTIISEDTEDFSFYPTELYSITPNEKVKHYYLDLFYYNNFNFYKSYIKAFFGDNYSFLVNRIVKCSDENVVFLSTDDYNEILKNYLLTQHDTNVSFEKTKSTLNYYKLNAYKVNILD